MLFDEHAHKANNLVAPGYLLGSKNEYRSLLRTKKGMLAIAKECNVGTGTVQRIAREIAGAGSPFAQAPRPPNAQVVMEMRNNFVGHR